MITIEEKIKALEAEEERAWLKTKEAEKACWKAEKAWKKAAWVKERAKAERDRIWGENRAILKKTWPG